MRPPMLRAGGFGITSAVAARSLTQLQLSATKSMITPHVGRKFRFGKLYIHSIYLNFYETQKKEMKKKSEKKIIKPAGNSEGYKSKAEKMASACHVYLLQKSGVYITVGMENGAITSAYFRRVVYTSRWAWKNGAITRYKANPIKTHRPALSNAAN